MDPRDIGVVDDGPAGRDRPALGRGRAGRCGAVRRRRGRIGSCSSPSAGPATGSPRRTAVAAGCGTACSPRDGCGAPARAAARRQVSEPLLFGPDAARRPGPCPPGSGKAGVGRSRRPHRRPAHRLAAPPAGRSAEGHPARHWAPHPRAALRRRLTRPCSGCGAGDRRPGSSTTRTGLASTPFAPGGLLGSPSTATVRRRSPPSRVKMPGGECVPEPGGSGRRRAKKAAGSRGERVTRDRPGRRRARPPSPAPQPAAGPG